MLFVQLSDQDAGSDDAIDASDPMYIKNTDSWHKYESDSKEQEGISLHSGYNGCFCPRILLDIRPLAEEDRNGGIHNCVRSSECNSTADDKYNNLSFVWIKMHFLQKNEEDSSNKEQNNKILLLKSSVDVDAKDSSNKGT